MNEDVTVLVSSCDKYEDAWEPFFRLFHIMGGDVFPKIVLNTESKHFDPAYLNVQTINAPGKLTWSQRIYHVLEQIDTDFVFHVLEDFFIQQPFNNEYFSKVMAYMRANPDVGAMHLTPNGRFPKDAKEMFLERNFDKLNITVTCVVWRRDFLMKLLRMHENIWQFEWYSTIRAKNFSRMFGSCNTMKTILLFLIIASTLPKDTVLRKASGFRKTRICLNGMASK